MSDETTLLPCPFCGGEYAQVRYMGGKWQEPSAFDSGYRGECCECGAITAACDTEAEAIAAWNTRAYLNPDGLPAGLTISDDGTLLNWRGENYVKQSTLDGGVCRLIRHGVLANLPSFVCWSCSECGFGWHHSENDKQFSYCPNCGAKVVG